MTSSLTHGVSKTSRAICAVVTASLTVKHPAVFGSTLTPSSRIRSQNGRPARTPPLSRRNETVATSAPDARNASARIAGEGYCAVPSMSGVARSVP